MKGKFFVIGLLLVLGSIITADDVVGQVWAQSFELEIIPSSVSTCTCSSLTPQNVQISVKNLYQYADTFSFTVEAPPGFTSTIQSNVMVNPGEKRNLDLFLVNIGCNVQPGPYKLKIKAKSGTTGETITKTVDIDVMNCYEVQLEIESKFRELCREENKSVIFDMIIKNKGKYTDTYELTASVPWALFSDNSFTIEAGKSKSVGLALVPPETATGLQNVNVVVKSQKFYSTDSETVQIDIKDCYQMSADLQPSEAKICLGETVTQKLTITNTGLREDNFSISVPNWVTLDRQSVSISPKKTGDVKLTFTPSQKGRTQFIINVTSSNDPKILKTISSVVDAEECRGVAVIVSPSKSTVCQGVKSDFLVSVKNLGKIQDSFNLTSNIGVLEVNKVVLGPGETEELKLEVSNITVPGTYKIRVRAESGDVSDEGTAEFIVENCYSASVDISPQNHSTCAGSPVSYTVAVKNTGKLAEEFMVSVESDLGNETRSVKLQPGEAKTENFVVSVPLLAEGREHSIKASAKSVHTSAEIMTTLLVKSAPQCHSVQVCTVEDKLVALCNATAIPVIIKNTGEKSDKYNISVEAPSWVYLSPDYAELAPGKQQIVYLYLSPCIGVEKGVYELKLNVISPNTRTQYEVGVGVVPEITGTPPEEKIVCKGPPAPPAITENVTAGNVTQPVTGNVTGLILGIDTNTWKIIAIVIITLVIIIILAIRFILLAK
ncbi:MAG: hypothetical protein QXN71_03365 [Candidatus Aenigmatarchaeota archaeon]